ncbi:MAG: hypothetical protein CMN51_08620, partial [SAR116 cluster bacterium]|nr:hypothetical protein [SAR116 cluster bacterium]
MITGFGSAGTMRPCPGARAPTRGTRRWDGAGSGRRDQVPKQHQGPDRRTSTSGMRCASPPVCRRARSTCNRNGR